MTAEQAEGTARTDLSDLLRNRMAELGLSIRKAADATLDPRQPNEPPQYKRGTLENLLKAAGTKAPNDAQCRALAHAFQLPELAVQRAAAAQFQGLVSERWDRSDKARVLVAKIDEMTDEDLEELDQLAEIVWRRRRQ
jgi:hypothetical protein